MFDAAKDFVFTNSADGKTITSGGYRISKMLGGAKKKQRGGRRKKQAGEEEEIENLLYNEESGIPMGLLYFSPKFIVEQEHLRAHAQSPRRKEDDEHNEHNEHNVIDIELVMPMASSPSHYNVDNDNVKNFNNCGLEDAKDVVDDDLFCKLLENASLADCASYHSERKMTRKRNENNVNLKNLKVLYAGRKTRKH